MRCFLLVALTLYCISCTAKHDFVTREYYGAKLEPVDHVLHGAGQCHPEGVKAYASVLDGRDPVLFMDYYGFKHDPAKYVGYFEKRLAEFPNYTALQLGVGMTQDGQPSTHYEHDVAAGLYDEQINQLFAELKRLDRPIYIRVGYECNGPWNGYEPEAFRKAFQHVTALMRESGLNAATVWCVVPRDIDQAMAFYPGDEWVDWWAVDIFSPEQIPNSQPFIDEARRRSKPVMIGESTPRYVGVLEGEESWKRWFEPYFALIRNNPGVKAFCYINWNWAGYPRWGKWGDGRIEQNAVVAERYRLEMSLPLYLHATSREGFEQATQPPQQSLRKQ